MFTEMMMSAGGGCTASLDSWYQRYYNSGLQVRGKQQGTYTTISFSSYVPTVTSTGVKKVLICYTTINETSGPSFHILEKGETSWTTSIYLDQGAIFVIVLD